MKRVVSLLPVLAIMITPLAASPAHADDGVGALRLSMDVPLGALLFSDRGGDPLFMAGVIGAYGADLDYQVTENLLLGVGMFGGVVGTGQSGAGAFCAFAPQARVEVVVAEAPYRPSLGAEVGGGVAG